MYRNTTDPDAALLERFARADFAPGTFRHRDHVHVAWALVTRHEPLEALRRMDAGVRALAARNDKPDLYHRTITWCYVLLIGERVARQGRAASFDEFAARNALSPAESFRIEAMVGNARTFFGSSSGGDPGELLGERPDLPVLPGFPRSPPVSGGDQRDGR